MHGYHSDLFDHLHQSPPPGYSGVSLQQLLRADRAAWLHMAEKLSSLKRDAQGDLPLEHELKKVLSHPSVSFHLLPLPTKSEKPAAAPKPKATPRPEPARPTRSRTPKRPSKPSKGQGKGKKGSKRGRGPNIPRGLIGKNLQTDAGERLCWAFNLEQGCSEAQPGQKCSRGLHLCAEPGCGKAHSLQSHK